MAIDNSSVAVFGTEFNVAMTGSAVLIGTLPQAPAIIIFDNQGAVSVTISVNQPTTVWRTFPAGEALVLDMRAAHGNAPNFTFPVGTTFFGNGTAGAANLFSISYIYAQDQ